MTAERVVHWGTVEPELLFDVKRCGPFAAAHHVAGHHWARGRLGLRRGPAGLRFRTYAEKLLPLECERAVVVEATAVLVEAMAIEAVLCIDVGAEFGIDREVDWPVVRNQCRSAHVDARARGCFPAPESVAALLQDESWTFVTGRKLLRGWRGIASLAELLGRGQVLEEDEVTEVLLGAGR